MDLMTAIDWTATFRRAIGANAGPAFRGLFDAIADALTIRGNLCQPARRIDAL
jgi:hypothetical protein